MNYNFEIKPLNTSRSRFFHDAMKVYCDNTPVDIYTNANELSEFIDIYNKNESYKHYFFACLLNDIVIGFSDIVYIKSLPMLLIDYFIIDKLYKKNCVFFTFLNMIISYFSDNNLPFNYIVTEISNRNNGKEIDIDGAFFKTLSKGEGFKEIKAEYEHPPLGDNSESHIECKLFIKVNDSKNSINKDTYLKIVREIYEHYSQWYIKSNILAADLSFKYQSILNDNYKNIKSKLNNIEKIQLSSDETINCKYYEKNNCAYYSSGSIPTTKNYLKKAIQIIVSLLVIIILSFILQTIINKILPNNLLIQYIPTIISSVYIAIFISKK